MARKDASQYHFKSNYYVLYAIKHTSMDKKTTTLGYTTAGRGDPAAISQPVPQEFIAPYFVLIFHANADS